MKSSKIVSWWNYESVIHSETNWVSFSGSDINQEVMYGVVERQDRFIANKFLVCSLCALAQIYIPFAFMPIFYAITMSDKDYWLPIPAKWVRKSLFYQEYVQNIKIVTSYLVFLKLNKRKNSVNDNGLSSKIFIPVKFSFLRQTLLFFNFFLFLF